MRFLWIAGGLLLTATIAGFAVVYARGDFVRLRAGTAAAPIRSLVVLPFENLTGDAGQGHLVEAVTDALTTHLAQVDGLDVISRTSARQYKRPDKRIPAIGNELNVDAVLEGSVVRSGERVRISVQLIHAATDRHVWARNYDDEVSRLLTLQQRIASDVAVAVGHPPSAISKRGRQTVAPQAYDAYLKGMTAAGRESDSRFSHGRGLFRGSGRQAGGLRRGACGAGADADSIPAHWPAFAPRGDTESGGRGTQGSRARRDTRGRAHGAGTDPDALLLEVGRGREGVPARSPVERQPGPSVWSVESVAHPTRTD